MGITFAVQHQRSDEYLTVDEASVSIFLLVDASMGAGAGII